ncbi:hypothetical protein [Xylophilus ampelinus]|uniref:Uncharacterized protein n=1 Tax=Xylophilus ampelinus TaxID=54067 RepID=A0A318SQX0_9BURK|nr:hypothetical protein [Xylophilus ampelinus]MCS4509143.1 hypothetical protein [Xylophilus ampelinus]PYE79829.1 hypothetical protein DFQ15_101149 [Xylophilus ampelinus]
MTDKTISAEQVAILAERVDTMLINQAKVEGLIMGISGQQNQVSGTVAVLQERLLAYDEKQRRLFQMSDEHGAGIDRLNAELKVHSWTWKLVGTVALASLGLVGWAYGELRGLYSQDNRHENRIAILEFLVGGRSPQLPRVPESKEQ